MSDAMGFGKGANVIVHAEQNDPLHVDPDDAPIKTMVNGTIVNQRASPDLIVVELGEDTEYKSTISEDYMAEKVESAEHWGVHIPIGRDAPADAPPGWQLCLHLPESDPGGDVFVLGIVTEIETPEREEIWEQLVEHMTEVNGDE